MLSTFKTGNLVHTLARWSRTSYLGLATGTNVKLVRIKTSTGFFPSWLYVIFNFITFTCFCIDFLLVIKYPNAILPPGPTLITRVNISHSLVIGRFLLYIKIERFPLGFLGFFQPISPTLLGRNNLLMNLIEIV